MGRDSKGISELPLINCFYLIKSAVLVIIVSLGLGVLEKLFSSVSLEIPSQSLEIAGPLLARLCCEAPQPSYPSHRIKACLFFASIVHSLPSAPTFPRPDPGDHSVLIMSTPHGEYYPGHNVIIAQASISSDDSQIAVSPSAWPM